MLWRWRRPRPLEHSVFGKCALYLKSGFIKLKWLLLPALAVQPHTYKIFIPNYLHKSENIYHSISII